MALPAELCVSMMPTELEFIAGEELIEIRPTVRMEKIRFISVRLFTFHGFEVPNDAVQ